MRARISCGGLPVAGHRPLRGMNVHAAIAAAAVADTVGVLVHGVVGGRWAEQQLRAAGLPASSLFGDADVGARVFRVTWHVVTAMFAVSAAALYTMAFGGAPDGGVLRFVAALHGAALLVGLLCMARRLDAFRRPVPVVFVLSMTTVVASCWLSAG